MMNNELYCAEYSKSQDCFNIDTYDNILKRNVQNTLRKTNNDFQIIELGSYDKCNDFINAMKGSQEKWETN